MNRRVLLAYRADAQGARDPFTSLLPVGLGTCHALLSANGHDSHLANLSGLPPAQVRQLLLQLKPALIGLSCFTHNRHETLKLAILARESCPDALVVLGGPHATFRAPELLAACPALDAVVAGEGEATLLELATRLAPEGKGMLPQVAGLVLRSGGTAPRPPIADLDAIPSLALFSRNLHHVDLVRQLELVVTARGCPAACRFCSSPGFWGRGLRFRSPEAMVAELCLLQECFGLLRVSLRDDTFTADRTRVLSFCDALQRAPAQFLWDCQSRVAAVDREMLAAMRRAGCECIQFGVESGSPAVLRTLGKGITPVQVRQALANSRAAGLVASVYLITGVPGETVTDVECSCRLLRETLPHDGQVAPLAYYPGTRLFADAVRAGSVPADLFERSRQVGLYVRQDAEVAVFQERLLQELWQVGEKAAYRPRDFARQEELVGWTPAGAVALGEYHEARGEWQKALASYRELVQRQPGHPWGWLKSAEAAESLGDLSGALAAYEKLLALVPAHQPARTALQRLRRSARHR